MQTQTSNTLHNAIMEAGSKDRWNDKPVLDFEGNLTTATERVFETYKNVTQEIRDQLNAEAEVVQIILTGIDNDIYSTVDACSNACEMWKAIKRLKQGESINVKDLETNLFWEFGKFTSLDGESLESYYSRFYKMMNELTRNQCKMTNHQVNVQFLLQLQPKWQRIVTLVKQSQELKHVSYHKLYDILKQHQHEVNEIRAEKIARESLESYYSRFYKMMNELIRNQCKVTNHQVNVQFLLHLQPEWQRNAGYESQRSGNVVGARETVELEAHYMYMGKIQEVSPDVVDSGPIFDTEPEQKVQNDDHYDMFAIELDMNYDSEQIDQNDEDVDLAKE
nr:hypothetical protein [Tanacetum cinerariifolium]